MFHKQREFQQSERMESSESDSVRIAIEHFADTCSKYGYEAEVRKIPYSENEIAIFIKSGSGEYAKEDDVYVRFLQQYHLATAVYPYDKFDIDTWRDGTPYLKVRTDLDVS